MASYAEERAAIPNDTHLFVCLECGRTDRFQRMGIKHYWHGKLCPGDVVRVRYKFAGIVPEAKP